MAEPDQDHEGSPAAAIIKGDDGFFRVRGQPESVYYSTEEQAERAARELLEAAGDLDAVDDGEAGGDE